jgi:hypothetical protein
LRRHGVPAIRDAGQLCSDARRLVELDTNLHR